MFDNKNKILRAISALLAMAALCCLFSCGDDVGDPKEKPAKTEDVIVINPTEPSENTEDPADETAVPTQNLATEVPEPTEKPTPTPQPKPTPYVDKYLDIWAIDHFYVVPGEKTLVGVKGNAGDWTFDGNDNFSHSVEGGKLYVTAKETGYVNLTSKTGSKAIVFSNKPVEKNENRKVKDGFPYYLYYEKGSHTLTIYTAGSDGYYTVPFRTICTACGSTPDKTPVGMHTLGSKVRWKDFGAHCKAQYGINYASGVFLHGPCYEYERESSILSHYYNTIGENSTGGCLRMQTGNIYWIYNNCESGTKLEIVNGSPRGTSCEIPEDIPESACFDPTDPYIKDRV